MTMKRTLAACLAASAFMLSACVNILPEVTPSTVHRLSTPEPSGMTTAEAIIVVIQRPLTPRALSGDQIAVSQNPGEIIFIEGAEWITPVPRMTQDLVLASIDAFEPSLIAARPEDGVRAEFELATELRTFEANYLDGPNAAPTVIVRYRVRLIRDSDRRMVAVGAVGARAQAASARLSDIVAAFDAASQEASAEIAHWTAGHVSDHHDPEHEH